MLDDSSMDEDEDVRDTDSTTKSALLARLSVCCCWASSEAGEGEPCSSGPSTKDAVRMTPPSPAASPVNAAESPESCVHSFISASTLIWSWGRQREGVTQSGAM